MEKAREFQKNIYFCFIDYAKAFDCVDFNKLWKVLKEMEVPDHLICLLRNLYAGQEATVRTGHKTTDWFKIEKGVQQGCIQSSCPFNLYAEHIMRKIAGRNINNLSYADDTTLMAESEVELKSLLTRVKEESTKVGLKLNIKKTKIMASDPLTSWQIDGEEMEVVTDFIFLGSKITADGDCSQEIKRHLLQGRKTVANLDSILKSRDITQPTKVHIVKAMVFPVAMYGCESWTIRKAERQRIEAFELWCWRRHLRVPWTARRPDPEDETQILWPPNEKEGLPGEEPNAGNNRWQKKKGTAEDEEMKMLELSHFSGKWDSCNIILSVAQLVLYHDCVFMYVYFSLTLVGIIIGITKNGFMTRDTVWHNMTDTICAALGDAGAMFRAIARLHTTALFALSVCPHQLSFQRLLPTLQFESMQMQVDKKVPLRWADNSVPCTSVFSHAGHMTTETVCGQTLRLGNGDEHRPLDSGMTGLNIPLQFFLCSLFPVFLLQLNISILLAEFLGAGENLLDCAGLALVDIILINTRLIMLTTLGLFISEDLRYTTGELLKDIFAKEILKPRLKSDKVSLTHGGRSLKAESTVSNNLLYKELKRSLPPETFLMSLNNT
ncbi:putative uncharacterized transposon-derived protein F52C9.6 [Varanus komodoensis]|nr:putative uncharacterized transposon-derived protein F52C9.6 [Varanus komodoensis]